MEERTKVKNSVYMSKSTPYAPIEIPVKDIPSSKIFEVKTYKNQGFVLILLDPKIWEELKVLCERRKLDPQKVMYGSIMKLKEQLKGGKI